MKVNFSKYEGAGNDFLIVQKELATEAVVWLCDRRRGVGADGIIFFKQSLVADFQMQIVNADGSVAGMCGNGLRCLARHLGVGERLTIETPCGVLTTEVVEDGIRTSMPKPTIHSWEIEGGAFLDTGVPHFVSFIDDIEKAPLHEGPSLRARSAFGPAGANIDWVQITGPTSLLIRTYERGVEGETLACGTGATAAALTYAHQTHISSPITVITRSGNPLVIDPHLPTMTGPAKHIFTGVATLPTSTMTGSGFGFMPLTTP